MQTSADVVSLALHRCFACLALRSVLGDDVIEHVKDEDYDDAQPLDENADSSVQAHSVSKQEASLDESTQLVHNPAINGDPNHSQFLAPSDAATVNLPGVPSGGPGGLVPAGDRTTTGYLTKYERARILGTRALQLSLGAPCMVELGEETDPLEIAQKELKAKKIPIIIRRYLPDQSFEDWTIDELICD